MPIARPIVDDGVAVWVLVVAVAVGLAFSFAGSVRIFVILLCNRGQDLAFYETKLLILFKLDYSIIVIARKSVIFSS